MPAAGLEAITFDPFRVGECRGGSGVMRVPGVARVRSPPAISLQAFSLAAARDGMVCTATRHSRTREPRLETPDSRLQTPDSRLGLKIRDSRLETQDSRPKTRDPRLGTQDSGLKTRDPRLGTQDSGLKTRTQDSDSRLGLKTRTQDSRLETQDSDSRLETQDSDSRLGLKTYEDCHMECELYPN